MSPDKEQIILNSIIVTWFIYAIVLSIIIWSNYPLEYNSTKLPLQGVCANLPFFQSFGCISFFYVIVIILIPTILGLVIGNVVYRMKFTKEQKVVK